MAKQSPESAMESRVALVEAGVGLLDGGARAAGLTAAATARAAGLKAAQFTACFPEMSGFHAALLLRLLDDLRMEISTAVKGMRAGRPRIHKGIEAYLDVQLKRPALRELAVLLHSHPLGHYISRKRIEDLTTVLTAEFKAARTVDAPTLARVCTAMLTETAQAEFEAHGPLADFRATLGAYLQRH